MIASEVAYKRTLKSAKHALDEDLTLKHFLLSLYTTKAMTLTMQKQRKKINKLAALGIIDLHLDETYKLSNVGRVLVKELQQR
jgi:hypothetical protein